MTDKTLEEQVGPVLGPLVQALGDYILRRMERGANDDWVNQHGSPLGPRRHCAIVRKLQEQGDERAVKRGDMYLLRRDAFTEAMAERGKAPLVKKASPPDPEQAAVERIQKRLGGK